MWELQVDKYMDILDFRPADALRTTERYACNEWGNFKLTYEGLGCTNADEWCNLDLRHGQLGYTNATNGVILICHVNY